MDSLYWDSILTQNALLAQEISRLCAELDEVTRGILKRGYLYKWRDREISFASKWGLRYFELKGSRISYFGDDQDLRRPRRTIDIRNCIVKREGTRKAGMFYVFSVYPPESEYCSRGPTSSVLLRLSSSSSADAEQWIDMIYKATRIHLIKAIEQDDDGRMENDGHTSQCDGKVLDLKNESNSKLQETLTSAKTASIILKRSQSRRSFLSSKQTPIDMSPVNETTNNNGRGTTPGMRPASGLYSASKPIHVQCNTSPLSTDARPGEQNYRGFFHLGLIIFAISHFRLIVDNLAKYGFLLRVPLWLLKLTPIVSYAFKNQILPSENVCLSPHCAEYTWEPPNLTYALGSWAYMILVSYVVERIISSPTVLTRVPDTMVIRLNTMILSLNLALPIFLVWRSKSHPLLLMLYLFQSVILWLKMFSYIHVNRDLRLAYIIIKMHGLKQSDSKGAVNGPGQVPEVQDVDDEHKTKVIVGEGESEGHVTATSVLTTTLTTNVSAPTPTQIQDTNVSAAGDTTASTALPVIHHYGDAAPPLSASLTTASVYVTTAERTASLPMSGVTDNSSELGHSHAPLEVRGSEPPYLQYPHNLTVLNLLYFCVAPTLCYQLNYPRSPKIRWRYLFTICVRLVVVSVLVVFFVEQYIKPNLVQAVQPLRDRDAWKLFNRLLKLCVPNTYVWLLGFYLFFHLWMNFLAELTRFGDRQFYKVRDILELVLYGIAWIECVQSPHTYPLTYPFGSTSRYSSLSFSLSACLYLLLSNFF